MAARRVLLLGAGDLTDETAEALAAADAEVRRLEDPDVESLREALAAGTDAVAVVSRDDAWPLRAALLVRHLDADVPIVATIFDPVAGRELEQQIGNCTITSLADIVAPVLAGPCLDDELAAVLDGGELTGVRCDGDGVEEVPLPAVRARRVRAFATAIVQPFDRSAGLVFFGAIGLALILVAETVSAAIVLEQSPVDAFYGAVKTLVTVDPNPEVEDGPKSYKVVVSISMIVALVFAAAFTGGLVERLVGRNLTGLLGRRVGPALRPRHRRRPGPGRAAAVHAAARGGRGGRRDRRPARRRARRAGAPAQAAGRDRPRRRPVAAAPALGRPRARTGRGHVRWTSRTSASRSPPPARHPGCGSSCARAATPPAARSARSSGSATSATCTGSRPSTSPGSRSAPTPSTSSSTGTPPTCARRTAPSRPAPTRSAADSCRRPGRPASARSPGCRSARTTGRRPARGSSARCRRSGGAG